MLSQLAIDPAFEQDRIVRFIRQQLAAAGRQRLVLGLSGGIDSSVAAALSVDAVGSENVHGMIMPYRSSNPNSEGHARLLAERFGITFLRYDISAMVDAIESAFPKMDARRRGNIMARCRMIALFDQTEAYCGLGMGTSNRTETLLGYFTIHGDGAAAFRPIAHLYKCQVRALARHMGVPKIIIDKAPSADLWAGQTDEDELGFSYDTADQVLYLLTEEHLSAAQIAEHGFDLQVVQAIKQKMAASAFKRRLPPSL